MRYGKQHPLGRDFQYRPSGKLQQGQGKWKPKDPAWTAWLTTNRAELESGWVNLQPLRTWCAELNVFDRIGDLTPPKSDAEILAYEPIRTLYRHACAVASLQALDGHGDTAVETLLPVLEFGLKLAPSSRTLVRSMVAIVAQKMAIETAVFVLDTTTVSPAIRTRLANALIGANAGEYGARRLVSIEYELATVWLSTPEIHSFAFGYQTPAPLRQFLQPLGPVMWNQRRTLNLYGDMTTLLQDLAARRNGTLDAEAARFIRNQGMRFKNFAGPLLISPIRPAYDKILENYWITEDLRLALHRRLQT